MLSRGGMQFLQKESKHSRSGVQLLQKESKTVDKSKERLDIYSKPRRRVNPGSNQGPSDLQSNALPTELLTPAGEGTPSKLIAISNFSYRLSFLHFQHAKTYRELRFGITAHCADAFRRY